MSNIHNTVLYIGVTNNLIKRIYEHKNKLNPTSFTAKYNITKLIYFEIFNDIYNAISREKQIKAGSRQKKMLLIASMNPNLNDLYEEIATPR